MGMKRGLLYTLLSVLSVSSLLLNSCVAVTDAKRTNGYLDLIPAINDTYDVGSPARQWNDGYFVNLHAGNLIWTVNSTTVANATYATTAGYAGSAGSTPYATVAGSTPNATYAISSNYSAYAGTLLGSVGNATYANTAGYAGSAGYATTAGYAGTAGAANTANNATYATTAGYAGSAGTATTALNANVTANGVATYIPYFTTATNLSQSIATANATAIAIGGNLQVNGNIAVTGTVDGVDISSLAIGGNTTSNGSAGYIPQFTTATNISNSIMTGNTTYITVNGGIQASSFVGLVANATYATTSNYAGSSGTSANATFATTAGYAGSAGSTPNATYAVSSNYSAYAGTLLGSVTNATYATTAGYAGTAGTSLTSNVTSTGTSGYFAVIDASTTNLVNGGLTWNGAIVTSTTNITMGTKAINNVADPSLAQDAATKNYVDTHGATPANTFTVSPSGANYTTIQAALTANPTANILVLVYPGTYTNDTINFTANGQSVIGVGTYAKQIVTAADAAVVNFAAYTGCTIRDMTVRVTAATSAIATVNGSTGTIFLYDSAVEMTNSNVATAAQPACIKTTGAAAVTFINGFLNYTNNVATTAGAGVKTAVIPALNSTTTFRRAAITIAGAGASELTIPIYGEATCTTQFYRCRITVTDLDTTAAIGFSYISGAGGTGENYSNTCHVTCGAGAGHEADGLVAVGTRNIRSMFNYINLTGNTQYPFQVDTGCTVVSEFDDIVSTGASITSGTGVLKFINSVTDGTLKVSGNILVYENITMAAGKTVDGVDISALASTFGNVTANGTVGRIPQFATSTNITNSIMTGNTTAITVNGNLQMGTTGNITLAAGMTVDGVDISALSASSGNVTANGVATYIPQFTTATNISNSIMTGNTTYIKVNGGIQATKQTLSGNLTMASTGNITMQSGMLVDGVDVSGHASRHQFLGADEINDKDILIARHPVWLYADAVTVNGYSQYVSGSGSTTIGRLVYVDLDTGVTLNSEACMRSAPSIYLDYTQATRRARWGAQVDWRTVATNSTAWFGFTTNAIPTDTENHATFKFLNGDIWCSCANGATQTIEDSGINYAQYDKIQLFIKYMGSDIKYYINGVLVKTFTTNRPNETDVRSTLYIKTTDTVDKEVWFYPVQVLLGDE